MLTVNEIFYSIQGESTFAGRPCVFVRLTACDLRCVWCDTAYAFTEGRKMEVGEVLAVVARHACPLVEITGGEPLLQDEVYPLMEQLLADGRTVLLETGGHVSVARVPRGVIKIMDVKCPASGESGRNHWENVNYLTSHDQVKFVIRDHGDFAFASDVLTRHALDRRCSAVLFSPVHGELDPGELASWVLAARLPVRVQLQLHKYIWGADARGV